MQKQGPAYYANAILTPAARSSRNILVWRPTIEAVPISNENESLALGIAFVNCPQVVEIGVNFQCEFRFIAWPDPMCNAFTAGVKFVLTEGDVVVGYGEVVAVSNEGV